MITINLKPGAKRQLAKGDPLAMIRQRLMAVRGLVKEPALVMAGGAWLLAVVVIGGLYLHTRSRLNTLEPQLVSSTEEFHRYHNFVVEKQHAGKARDSILAQIGTISAVDQDRYTWSHVLDEVAGAMPEFTWLTSVSPVAKSATPDADSTTIPAVTVLIAGQTNDLQNYTTFLRRLGESHWLTNVVPVKTETIIDKSNRPITAFTVQATFMRGDTSMVTTVPILESSVR
ncbi:MAG TPA: PilN domain-containing protein [Gemmatimonadales bacterium]|jgi:Tfp pilus assembly protein PilN